MESAGSGVQALCAGAVYGFIMLRACVQRMLHTPVI